MRHHISLSEDTLKRLKAIAEPFVDREPEDVIKRLLDGLDSRNGDLLSGVRAVKGSGSQSTKSRAPRERGARVQIGDHIFEAISVRDLYQQVLRFFVETHGSELQTIVPLQTSKERYLLAREPVHPSGNPFVVPVEFRGFYLEGHKDYKNAIEHLRMLARRLGLELTYLG